VILPVFAETLLHLPQIIFGVGIEIAVGEFFQYLTLRFQAFPGNDHQSFQALEKFALRSGEVANPRHVDGDDAYGTGQGMGPEQASPPSLQVPVVDAQPAAHAPGILGTHIGVDEIGEIGHPVFGRHFPETVKVRIFPIEVPCDIVGRDRKGKDPTLGIAGGHDLEKRLVEQIHLILVFAVGFPLRNAADDHMLIRVVPGHGDIEGNVGKGSLKPYPGGNVDIEDELLEDLLDLLVIEAIGADKGCQEGIEIGKGLGPRCLPLEGIEEIYHLPQNTAEMSRRLALHLAGYTLESFQEQIVKVPAHAVNRQQTQVVNMEIPLAVGLPDLRGIDLVKPVNLADLGRYIVVQSLERIIHVTVLVHLPVDLPEVLIHEVDLHFVRDLPQAGMLIPVDDISLGGPPVGRIQKHLFDDILDFLHRHDLAVEKSLGQVQDPDGHLVR